MEVNETRNWGVYMNMKLSDSNIIIIIFRKMIIVFLIVALQ